jgi:putative transcriptional regulator
MVTYTSGRGWIHMVKIHLSRLLGERRMTQKELHEKTGIRYETVGAYYHEFVKRMNRGDIDKMCRVLGCRIEDLLEYIPDKKG